LRRPCRRSVWPRRGRQALLRSFSTLLTSSVLFCFVLFVGWLFGWLVVWLVVWLFGCVGWLVVLLPGMILLTGTPKIGAGEGVFREFCYCFLFSYHIHSFIIEDSCGNQRKVMPLGHPALSPPLIQTNKHSHTHTNKHTHTPTQTSTSHTHTNKHTHTPTR
jgi:hypothetical protein